MLRTTQRRMLPVIIQTKSKHTKRETKKTWVEETPKMKK